ncbi:MAG: zinc ribbon domain-containing protein [Legionella sp.]|nr:MAG: zinc ribbon domain-containing protein [Legionella sp.]
MPIYEYQCTNCHHHVDIIQKVSDAPETKCPECAKESLVKLVSAAGFQLKGTGWYETDFKTKKPSASATSKSTSEATATKENTTTTTCKGENQ